MLKCIDTMRYLVICVFFSAVFLANVENGVATSAIFSGACSVFDAESQILAIYCDKFEGKKPTTCTAHNEDDFTKYPTTQYKFGGCDFEDVKRFMASHGNVSYLDISQSGYNHIGSFNLGSVMKLNATHNPLRKLEEGEPFSANQMYFSWNNVKHFTWKSNLRIVGDSSVEGIFKVSTIGYELHCHENSFENIEKFVVLENTKGNSIENPFDLLKCLGTSLKVLLIAGNSKDQLNSDVFQKFPHLRTLIIANISVTDFDFNGISHLRNLSSLYLRNNDMSNAKNIQVLENFNEMHEIGVSRNKFVHIHEVIQHLNPNIRTIIFENVTLSPSDLNALHKFKKLRTLDISNNNFTQVDLSKLPKSIVDLNLEGNELTALDLPNLTNLPNLRFLNIAHNRMTREYVNDLMKNDEIKETLGRIDELEQKGIN